MTKWDKTPFKDIEEALGWANKQGLLIEPCTTRGLNTFTCVDGETETLVAQRTDGGPVLSYSHTRPPRMPVPIAERVLQYGEDPPWIWSPALSSLAAVEKLFDNGVTLKGDYIAYRKGPFIHEYVITWDNQVWQRIIAYKEV